MKINPSRYLTGGAYSSKRLLKEAAGQTQAVYKALTDGVWVAEIKTKKILQCNSNACRMFGYSQAQFLTKRIPDLHPPRNFKKAIDPFHPWAEKKKTLAENVPCRKKDGTVFWADIAARPARFRGRKCLVGFFRNVTERKQAAEALRDREAFLSAIYQGTHEVLFAVEVCASGEFRFIGWNRAGETLTGVRSADAEGRTPVEVFGPEMGTRLLTRYQRCVKQGDYAYEEVSKLTIFQTSLTALRDPVSGRVVKIIGVTMDITERKRSEEALHESKDLSVSVLMTIPFPIDVVDKDGNILMVNERMEKIIGLGAVGKKCWTIYKDDKKQCRHCPLRTNIGLGKTETMETEKALGGKTLEIHHIGMIFGGKKAILEVFIDITERKRSEEALRESEEKFRAMFETSPSGMALCEMDGAFVQVNQAYLDMIGYTRKEALKLTFWDLTPKEYGKFEKKQLRSLEKTGRYGPYEKEYIRKTGKRIPVLLNGAIVTGADGKKRIWSVVMDITERKKSEEILKESRHQLLQIIDTVPHIIFARDSRGRFLLVNRALAGMYDKEPQELIGVRFQDIHPVKEESEKFLGGDREVLLHGKPILVSDGVFTDIHKKVHILQTIKVPLEMQGIKETVILGVSVDVTEQRKVEEFRNDIVRTVSHELRTPLSIEKGGVGLLLDGSTGTINKKQKTILTTVMKNIDRLSRMIDSLLSISKIEAGKIELKKEAMNLSDAVREVIFDFKIPAKEKNIKLETDLPKEKAMVFADPDRIMQVVSNLVDNALKFTLQGSVTLSIRILQREVECDVRDTGIGITAENMPKLFEKFQQFSRIVGPGEKGLGLGLSIAKEIVEMHGGKLWSKSALGQGTTMTFILPKMQK